MEIGEVFSVKDEVDIDFNQAITDTCKICKSEVAVSDFNRHVEKQHGLGEEAYSAVAANLEDFFGDNDERTYQGEASAGDQIENRCTFQCKMCDYVSISWRNMTDHYSQSHRNEKRDPWGPHELAVTKKYYKCQECPRILLQDKRIINAHMRSNHKAQHNKYKKMVKKGMKSAAKLKVFSGDNGTDQCKAPLEDEIENGCTFQCKMCDYASSSWRYMTDHYRFTHWGPHGGPHELAVTKKFYKCQECPIILLQDRRVIYTHMRNSHKERNRQKKMFKKGITSINTPKSKILLTNGDHAEMKVSNEELIVNGCQFKCKYCAHYTNSWRFMTTHIFRTHRSAPKLHDPMDLVVEKVFSQCTRCGKSLLQDKRIIYNHKALCSKSKKKETKASAEAPNLNQEVHIISKETLKREETPVDQTSGEGDGGASDLQSICKFQCHPCGMVFNTWRLTQDHLLKRHEREKQKKKKRDITKYLVETHYHKCFLCEKEILQDLEILRWHVKSAHNLGVQEYTAALARITEGKHKVSTSQTPVTTFGSPKNQGEEANFMKVPRVQAVELLTANPAISISAPKSGTNPNNRLTRPKSGTNPNNRLTRSAHETVTVQVDPDLYPIQKKGVKAINGSSDAKSPAYAKSPAFAKSPADAKNQCQSQSQEVEVITLEDVDETEQVSNGPFKPKTVNVHSLIKIFKEETNLNYVYFRLKILYHPSIIQVFKYLRTKEERREKLPLTLYHMKRAKRQLMTPMLSS